MEWSVCRRGGKGKIGGVLYLGCMFLMFFYLDCGIEMLVHGRFVVLLSFGLIYLVVGCLGFNYSLTKRQG